MADTIFIKPSPGKLVRDPVTREPLPETGAEKPRTTYWLRRLRDGDVYVADPPKPETQRPKTKEETA